jgi:hypothetical protein
LTTPSEEDKEMAGSASTGDRRLTPDSSWRPLYRAGAAVAGLGIASEALPLLLGSAYAVFRLLLFGWLI